MIPVLVVEDDIVQQKMLCTLLKKRVGFDSLTANNGREAIQLLSEDSNQSIKIIILDIDMPVMNGMEALDIIKKRFPDLAVVMVTANHDIDKAVQAMKLGAIDFLTKPYEVERLSITVKNALKIKTLSKEMKRLKQEKKGALSFENLIGHETGLSNTVIIGRKAAASDIPLLITGETGVGKEIFCQAVHGAGYRTKNPFIAINCGAIPTQLVESTLFGHEKGSFTGATEKAIGKFREAEGGTVFLDEIGELPLDAQVKLLRVLQQKEVEPVGCSQAIPVNVRIISATNRDLQAEVKAGRFREDLYFRLNVLEIELPPLRDRKNDIPALARHFIERFCAQEELNSFAITDEAQTYLMEHEWPGNIRELENAISRAIVLSKDNVLDRTSFFKIIGKESRKVERSNLNDNISSYSIFDHQEKFKNMEVIEQEIIQLALQKFDHNVAKAADALGIAKSTFYRKMNYKH